MRDRTDASVNHMPLRTRVFTTLLDRFGRESIVDMDLDGIRRSRARVTPTVPPFTLITGSVFGDVTRKDTCFPARDGHHVPLRIYRTAGSRERLPVVVFFHGGGWVLGNTRMYDPLCTFLARAVGALVVSVDYRMAPEHRAPKAVHDSVDSVRWLAGHTDSLGGNASRLAVSGDSAGGNLAASHADLPPALVQTADLDPLRDEGMLYAQRLAAAGVPMRHTNYLGAPHGFASFPGATTVGKKHRAELVSELRRHLHP